MLCLIYPDSVWGLSNYKKSVHRRRKCRSFLLLPGCFKFLDERPQCADRFCCLHE